MRVCLLTQHPQLLTQQRLLTECRAFKLDVSVVCPEEYCWVWPNEVKKFDLTFNRLSPVESGAYEISLGLLPVWGTQVNSWDLRLKLWDKSRQIIWLDSFDIKAPATFMVKGVLEKENLRWRSFADKYSTGDGWVLKFNRGQKGVGVNFIKTEDALLDWVNTLYRMRDQDFLIQPRLTNVKEYRLTLLGGRPWSLLERTGEKANFAQGGSAQEIGVKDWPGEIMDLADKLSMLGGASYLCLDILIGSQGAFVLDVNTMPGVEQLEQVSGRNFVKELLELSIKHL